jgi:hypothetical protein
MESTNKTAISTDQTIPDGPLFGTQMSGIEIDRPYLEANRHMIPAKFQDQLRYHLDQRASINRQSADQTTSSNFNLNLTSIPSN